MVRATCLAVIMSVVCTLWLQVFDYTSDECISCGRRILSIPADGDKDELQDDDDERDREEVDDNRNGIPDYLEGDTDGDGIPDYLDNDDDGNGILDELERDWNGKWCKYVNTVNLGYSNK